MSNDLNSFNENKYTWKALKSAKWKGTYSGHVSRLFHYFAFQYGIQFVKVIIACLLS